MTEPLRNYGDHGGATAVYAVQAPQWHRAFVVTGALDVKLRYVYVCIYHIYAMQYLEMKVGKTSVFFLNEGSLITSRLVALPP